MNADQPRPSSDRLAARARRLAVALLLEAGRDPRGLTGFFRILLDERERKPNALEALFASHPLTEDRIRDVQARIDRLEEARLDRLRSNIEDWEVFQDLLREYSPPPEKFRVRRNE